MIEIKNFKIIKKKKKVEYTICIFV
jgi:hypothetical protein